MDGPNERAMSKDTADYAIFIRNMGEDEWATYLKANLIALETIEEMNNKLLKGISIISIIAGGALAFEGLRRVFKARKL